MLGLESRLHPPITLDRPPANWIGLLGDQTWRTSSSISWKRISLAAFAIRIKCLLIKAIEVSTTSAALSLLRWLLRLSISRRPAYQYDSHHTLFLSMKLIVSL